jgi:precorrin-2 dehydrogenase/sirohydrochlorin ferrochelatase
LADYAAFLDLADRLVLLVGGGRVAARKLGSLLEAGARVRLVAPRLIPQIRELASQPGVEHLARGFEPEDLTGAWLVICATDHPEVNRKVAALAHEKRLFCNLAEQPDLGSFRVPSSVRRGGLCLAISTGGASPALARRLRRRLEREFGPGWGPYVRLLAAVRGRLMAREADEAVRRERFYDLLDSELLDRVASGDPPGVEAELARVLGPGFSLDELGLAAGELQPPAEEEA